MDGQLVLIIAATIVVAIIIAAALNSKPQRSKAPDRLPYDKEPYLLSPAERQFFYALCKAIGREMHIFPKVRLIDIVKVRQDAASYQSAKNSIIQKHVDFVICERDSFAPLLVVELDDVSHRTADRQSRDNAKDNILKAAGIPILRVTVNNRYNPQALAAAISGKVST